MIQGQYDYGDIDDSDDVGSFSGGGDYCGGDSGVDALAGDGDGGDGGSDIGGSGDVGGGGGGGDDALHLVLSQPTQS